MIEVEVDHRDPRLKDFRNFLYALWIALKLPEPTRAQYALAAMLQHGPNRLSCQAFRGVGKSFVAAAFVLWKLYWDPNTKILVASANQDRAHKFTTFCLRLLKETEWLVHLYPDPTSGLRAMKGSFDVQGSTPSQSPSMFAGSIGGMLTGSRADIIIADDIEIPQNSDTPNKRDILIERIAEFSAVLTPKPDSKIIFLGTPQSQESIYPTLQEKGFETWVWPSRYPINPELYGGTLAPELLSDLILDASLKEPRYGASGTLGKPTDTRFDELTLCSKELEYGRSGYARQFQLDTSGSDAERFPLKLRDMSVVPDPGMDLPAIVRWGATSDLRLMDYPSVGFKGDCLHSALKIEDTYVKPQAVLMSLDPAGTGSDEFAAVVIKVYGGTFYICDVVGLFGGHSPENLTRLAMMAKEHGVREILIEENFGMGAIGALLGQYLQRIYPCTMSQVHSSGQKEKRIIEALEPMLNQHRIILTSRFLDNDLKVARDGGYESTVCYRLLHQLTHITDEKKCLVHDDRLDALAQGVAYLVRHLDMDPDTADKERKGEYVQNMHEAEMRHDLIGYLTNSEEPEIGNWFSL